MKYTGFPYEFSFQMKLQTSPVRVSDSLRTRLYNWLIENKIDFADSPSNAESLSYHVDALLIVEPCWLPDDCDWIYFRKAEDATAFKLSFHEWIY